MKKMDKDHDCLVSSDYKDAKLIWADDVTKPSHRMSQESSKLATTGTMKLLKAAPGVNK